MQHFKLLLTLLATALPVVSYGQIDQESLNTIKRNQRVAERIESAKNLDSQRIAESASIVDRIVVNTAWSVFSELKSKGVKFQSSLRMPPNPLCTSRLIDNKSLGEFVVYRAHCDTLYARFQPVGNSEIILAAIQHTGANGTPFSSITYEVNCTFGIIGVDGKEYVCNTIPKAQVQAEIARDIRNSILASLTAKR